METKAVSKTRRVTVTVVAGTILLAIIVFILHLNEKVKIAVTLLIGFSILNFHSCNREDESERRRVSHHNNFDAL